MDHIFRPYLLKRQKGGNRLVHLREAWWEVFGLWPEPLVVTPVASAWNLAIQRLHREWQLS